MIHPDDLETLAMRAALAPPEQARAAWCTLVAEVEWMDLPDRIYRCLPSIAVALSCQAPGVHTALTDESTVPHAARLAGVYRSTWTDNVLRVRAIGPILDALDARAVDYRVLKGAAVCALTDRWGVRRMGDIDIAVRADHVGEAVQVLRDSGYTPRFFRRVSSRRPPKAMCWEGPGGAVLDLHVCDERTRAPWKRTSIIDRMLDKPALRVPSQNRFWMLPSPEVLVVHAVHHAHVAAATSDHAQAILDIARLLPYCDMDRVMALATDVDLGPLTLSLCMRASDLSDTSLPIVAEEVSRRMRRDAYPASGGLFRVLLDASAVIAERWPTRGEVVALRSVRDLRRLPYALWLLGGRMRPVERAVSVSLGGFLRAEGLSADLGRDRRRRVVTPQVLRGGPVEVTITSGDPYAQLLFIDGVSHGVIQGTARVRLDNVPSSLEVSLRLLGDPPGTSGMRADCDGVRIVIARIDHDEGGPEIEDART